MSTAVLVPIIGILAAIIGALVGAFANRLVNRPIPRIVVDQVSIESIGKDNPLPESSVTIDRGLVTASTEAPFVTVEFPDTQKTEEHTYIAYLNQVIERVNDMLDYRLPLVERVAIQLRENLHYEDHDRFEEIWARYQDSIWEVLDAGHYREDADLRQLIAKEDNDSISNKIEADKKIKRDGSEEHEGDLWVYIHGGKPVGFRTSQRTRTRKEAEIFAGRTALAFVNHERQYLKPLVKHLCECDAKYRPTLTQLKEQVQNELDLYRRLLFKGQATNAGRSPYSVLNKGRLFVNTHGLRYEENGKPERYQGTMRINMVLVDTAKQLSTPLSIGSGEVSRFTAVSERYVSQLEKPKVLLDTFNHGDTTCYMGLLTTISTQEASSTEASKKYYTRDRDFKDWETELDIPPKRR